MQAFPPHGLPDLRGDRVRKYFRSPPHCAVRHGAGVQWTDGLVEDSLWPDVMRENALH